MAAEATLDRLEKWKYAHKARSVQIEIDNGYGATCWTVDLRGEQKRHVCGIQAVADDYTTDPPHHVRAVGVDGDWGTLEATITAALDRWQQLYPDEVKQ